jgi:hypothetical protein
MIYEDFPSISLILVITLFCVFLCFRDLHVNWPRIFWALIFLPREAPGEEEVNETRPRSQTSTSGTGPWPGHATHTRLCLEPPLSSIFVSRHSTWPKKAYINTPLDDRETRRRRNTKHRNRGCSSEDWRGKRCWSHPGCFSTLFDINTNITAMKRE